MILEINKLIEIGAVDKALDIVNEEIMKSSNSGKVDYHELLFAKARLYMIKFKETRPVNNNLFYQAMEEFAQADNAYKAICGKRHPDYQIAVETANQVFKELNQPK